MPVLPAIADDQATLRLDRYLRQQFPKLSLTTIQRSIRQRRIRINDRRITAGHYRLSKGDQVSVPQYFVKGQDDQPARAITLNPGLQEKLKAMLVADTEQYFVLNKPSGLAVQGGTGVRWHLERLLPQLALLFGDDPHSLHLVHRLDRATSGLLLVARGRRAAQQLGAAFREHRIRKLYLAICEGIPDQRAGCFDQAIGKIPHLKGESRMGVTSQGHHLNEVKAAKTLYRIIDQSGDSALVQLQPVTGRKHQLRVHLAATGTPIAGDQLYGKKAVSTDLIQPGHLCLHAWSMQVPHQDGVQIYGVDPPQSWLAYAQARTLQVPQTCPGDCRNAFDRA